MSGPTDARPHRSDTVDRGFAAPDDTAGAGVDPAVAALYGTIPAAVEEALVATGKRLALSTPAPSYDPWYGLDRAGGPSLRVLERLTRHGDFRKYVFVLDAGAGLGGVARWLAIRYGCRVLALDVCRAQVEIARRLTRRVRLADRVASAVGSFEAVPVRDGAFTQIWCVEALQHARDRRRALAELYRVLRPGSPLALQEVVRRNADVPVLGEAWRHGTEAEYLAGLAAAGFTDVRCEDVTSERAETSPVVLSAAARLERVIAARMPEDAPWRRAAAARRDAAVILAGPDYRVLQFFARRPST